MQERMKIRSVSFSDEAQPPALPARNHIKRSQQNLLPNGYAGTGTNRKHTSAESLPVLEQTAIAEPIYGFTVNRMNSLPRLGSRGRSKQILDSYRPSSSLAGHYNYLGNTYLREMIMHPILETDSIFLTIGDSASNLTPDYANLTSISRRSTALHRQSSLQNDFAEGFEMQQWNNGGAPGIGNPQHHGGGTGSMANVASTAFGTSMLNAPNNNSYLTAPASNDLDSFSPSSYGTNESFSSVPRTGSAYPRGGGQTGNGYDSLPRGGGGYSNGGTTSILKNGRAGGRHLAGGMSSYDYSNSNGGTGVLRPLKGLYRDEADFSDPLGGFGNRYGNGYDTGSQRWNYDQSFGNANTADVTTRLLEDTDSSHHMGLGNSMNNKNDNVLNANGEAVGGAGQTEVTELPEDAYPSIAKPSASMQIIATRNRPCCECVRNDQRAPICLLFIIFLVVSVSVISGVMIYLKSG